MRAKFVNEKFREDTDPIHDMGIGIEQIIYKFKKEIDEQIPWFIKADIFKYHPDERLIRIDCYGLSGNGLELLKNVLRFIIEQYKDILTITHMPTWEEDTKRVKGTGFIEIKVR